MPLAGGHSDNGAPIVHVRLNDKVDGRFLFDSGTSAMSLSDRVADQLQLPRKPALNSQGMPQLLNGKPAQRVTLSDTQIGDQDFTDTPYVVMEDKALQAAMQEPIDGIIGAAFLRQHAVLFDFAKRTITIWVYGNVTELERKQAGLNNPTVAALTLDKGFNLRALLRYNDAVSEPAVIDTGAATTLVSADLARQLKLRSVQPSRSYPLLFETVRLHEAVVDKITLGNTEFHHVPVGYTEEPTTAYQTCLGLDVLSPYLLLIDVPQKTLFLQSSRPKSEAKIHK